MYSPMTWPWSHDENRRRELGIRFRILSNDHEDGLLDYMRGQWLPDNFSAIGRLDISWNPIATFCAALSSPGLYGQPPTIAHADPAAAPFVETNGILEHASWAGVMQRAEYFARGLCAIALHPYLGADNVLDFELVYPHDLYVQVMPSDPKRPVRLYHLRYYPHQSGDLVPCFDAYDLTDPENPRFYVVAADKDRLTVDIGQTLAPQVMALSGDAYPWRYADGRPFLPYTFYRTDPTHFWGAPKRMEPLARSTFFASELAQMARLDAGSSTFQRLVAIGCRPETANVAQDTGTARHAIAITPGSITLMVADDNAPNPQVIVIPSRNPAEIFRTVSEYQSNAFANAGLHVPDITRTNAGANPTSAAALMISDTSRREEQQRLAPMFRPSDLELLGKTAALLNRATGTAFPEDGYSVSYHVLPLSPAERAATIDEARQQYTDGLISRAALYQAYHPGTSIDGAIQALVRAQTEEAQINALLPRAPTSAPAPAATNADAADMEDTEDSPSESTTPTPEEE